MRQLITRIDDELHALLRAEAAAHGRSLNSFVTEILAAAIGGEDRRRSVRERARVSGRLVIPERSGRTPSRERALRATRGTGTAVSDALDAERANS